MSRRGFPAVVSDLWSFNRTTTAIRARVTSGQLPLTARHQAFDQGRRVDLDPPLRGGDRDPGIIEGLSVSVVRLAGTVYPGACGLTEPAGRTEPL